MFNWNKKEITTLINYLKSINTELPEVLEDIELLTMLKKREDKKGSKKETINYNLEEENKELKELSKHDNILLPILDKYSDDYIDTYNYKKIISTKKDILLFTRDNIKQISPQFLKELEFFFSIDQLDFNKNNPTQTIYLTYLNKAYVSLNKEDNIGDFYNPTHELLHVYYFLKNSKAYEHIENEFLSIFGELVTSYEMKKKLVFKNEVIKNDIESYKVFLDFIKSIILKRTVIINNIEQKNKIKYLTNELSLPKSIIKDIYTTSLEYNYKYVIGYVLAIELFYIYLIDKEKALHIIDKIIKSNDPLNNKLKVNNINLLEHTDDYIKKLKKNIP